MQLITLLYTLSLHYTANIIIDKCLGWLLLGILWMFEKVYVNKNKYIHYIFVIILIQDDIVVALRGLGC